MINLTVALPIWNSKKIAWLPMESLCRQQRPCRNWELIVLEERHDNQVGEQFILSYQDRLKEVGCEKVTYLTAEGRIPLPQKWRRIAYAAADTSVGYLMCAADNYYHPWMLKDSEDAMLICDWFVVPRGYFYDFKQRKVIEYNLLTNIGLQMTASTPLVRNLPMATLNHGVDGWFYKNLHPTKKLLDSSEHWKFILCTNGLNNISKSRHTFFSRVRKPFYNTDVSLRQIVPYDIAEYITQIKL